MGHRQESLIHFFKTKQKQKQNKLKQNKTPNQNNKTNQLEDSTMGTMGASGNL